MNTPDQPADALQAKINVSVANARVLVSSWLPTALAPVRGDSEAPKQETQEITHIKNGHPSPLLHRLGLGAPPPLNGASSAPRRLASSEVKRKLMGNKPLSREKGQPQINDSMGKCSSDEDGGRSSVGRPKRIKTVGSTPTTEGGREIQKVERTAKQYGTSLGAYHSQKQERKRKRTRLGLP